jgi:hypothetical protein
MSRIVIVMLIYLGHNPIDLISLVKDRGLLGSDIVQFCRMVAYYGDRLQVSPR